MRGSGRLAANECPAIKTDKHMNSLMDWCMTNANRGSPEPDVNLTRPGGKKCPAQVVYSALIFT
jgi:hypothetical protein